VRVQDLPALLTFIVWVLQCVVVYCRVSGMLSLNLHVISVLQCVAVCCNVLHSLPVCFSVCCSEGCIPSLDILGAFCSVLRCIVVWVVSRHSIFFCVRVAACCSVLQCVSECVAVWVVSRHSICIVCVLRYVAACFTVSSIY